MSPKSKEQLMQASEQKAGQVRNPPYTHKHIGKLVSGGASTSRFPISHCYTISEGSTVTQTNSLCYMLMEKHVA